MDVTSAKMKKGTVVKTTFDEYRLVEQVGEGGNARVFSVENNENRKYAIKFIKKDNSKEKIKRFKNEIHFCENHSSKNIVKILDRGYVILDNTEYIFYVMPLYDETLRNKMKKTISPENALTIFIGLINGLDYAHRNGAIHRDIKPENIMFESGSLEPIICDFGIAHFEKEDLLTFIETKQGSRLANFQYAAPEQRSKGKPILPQTDIYAAALILNEMFTGEVPQAGDYKTISSVSPEYQFLDEVFDLLFKQDASERLYPCNKILTEIKLRADKYKRDQELQRLQKIINEVNEVEQFNAEIINKEYKNGNIVFTLNRDIPHQWFQIISGGLESYATLLSYPPQKLKRLGDRSFYMPIYGNESPDTVKTIVKHVIDWVGKANHKYTFYKKTTTEEEQRKREKERMDEIAKIEKEKAISDILAQI